MSNSAVLSVPAPRPITRVEPHRGFQWSIVLELWAYREVVYFLTWRDVKVRYKQTLLGVSWAIIQPLMTMVVFSIFLGHYAGVPSDGIPYPLFSLAGLVPWTFFANSLSQSSNSLVNGQNLIKKVYFPRAALPLSTVFASLVDFLLAFLVLLATMAFYGIGTADRLLWLPLFCMLSCLTAAGIGLLLAAVNVYFRDVRHSVPFLVQLWFFATPVAYASSMLPGSQRVIYGLNPMAGVVEGFRWALLGADTAPGPMLIVSAIASVLMFLLGVWSFGRLEGRLADIV